MYKTKYSLGHLVKEKKKIFSTGRENSYRNTASCRHILHLWRHCSSRLTIHDVGFGTEMRKVHVFGSASDKLTYTLQLRILMGKFPFYR